VRVRAEDKPLPPDAPRQERTVGREWLQSILAKFGPITETPGTTAVLDFEKPLLELDNRITEVRCHPALIARPGAGRAPRLCAQPCA